MESLKHRPSYVCRACSSALRRSVQTPRASQTATQMRRLSSKKQLPTTPVRTTSQQYTRLLRNGQSELQWTSAGKLITRTAATSARAPKLATAPPPKASAKSKNKAQAEKTSFWENDWTIFSADNAALVKKAQEFGDRVLQAKGVPEDATVTEAMQVIEFAAAQLTRVSHTDVKSLRQQVEKKRAETGKSTSPPQAASQPKQNTSENLLSLDRSSDTNTAHPMSISISTDVLSSLASKILQHQSVFITPEVLTSYVNIQASLGRPESFPSAFRLYSSKPVPTQKGSSIKYAAPNPDSYKQAIPKEVADAALEAAIAKKDLELAIAIIDASFATKAFQRNKFIIKAFPAISGLALTPVAAGVLASQLPTYFPIANPSELVTFATVGMISYVAGISMLGFVVITTTNDHMERVTWAPGMALRERWLREEERAAVDKVAMAWGFKEGSRRGEEQGLEWDGLKEWCGLRGMILDKTELMEGME